MLRPVALLTDFGLTDAYVGVLKAVLHTRLPGATLLDLCHSVPPQDITAGALLLHQAAPYCPEDTVFLAVVDPGVGSSRRPICLRVAGRTLVGPDNGLLWPAATLWGAPEAFVLDRPECWLPDVGRTFHGRDIFAPVAAALAGGTPCEALGTTVTDPVRLAFPVPAGAGGALRGEVIYVDHYGNAVTSLTPSDLGHPEPGGWRFQGEQFDQFGPVGCYADAAPGEVLVLAGSFGRYEVAVRGGNAAREVGLRVGSELVATRR